MRCVLAAVCLLALFACGCASTATYSTLVQIEPASQPGEYVVQARVLETRSSWYYRRQRQLTSPVVTCRAGTPAELIVSTDGDNGLWLKAYIPAPGEDKRMTCSLTIKKNGEVLTATELVMPRLAASPPASPASPSPPPP